MSIGWPEGIYLGLMAVRVIVHAANDGEPVKDAKYRFGICTVLSATYIGLLYWGGFFD